MDYITICIALKLQNNQSVFQWRSSNINKQNNYVKTQHYQTFLKQYNTIELRQLRRNIIPAKNNVVIYKHGEMGDVRLKIAK